MCTYIFKVRKIKKKSLQTLKFNYNESFHTKKNEKENKLIYYHENKIICFLKIDIDIINKYNLFIILCVKNYFFNNTNIKNYINTKISIKNLSNFLRLITIF